MKVLLQRISQGAVTAGGEVIASGGPGLCLFVGVAKGDTQADAAELARKATELRIFEDAAGKMNLSLKDVQGEALVVSEFTLCGDCGRGLRPSFERAAPPAEIASSKTSETSGLRWPRADSGRKWPSGLSMTVP